jgi:ferredoxin
MSSSIKKHPLNVKGKYYVDYDVCLHHCCFDIAPNNFKLDQDCVAYVFKQPETLEEESQCKNAKDCCPVEAIHDDGI